MPGRGYGPAKRAFDLVVASTLLVVLSPLLMALAALIPLSSKGPILYRGMRVGKNGRLFRILKFRTMIVDAEQQGTTTALNDSRITAVGRILRYWKLDELPQLINVLRGEMSIVGPRPEVAEHTSAYTEEELRILSVTPGITDYASIALVNLDEILGSEDPHGQYLGRVRAEKNLLRLAYVDRRSFAEDMRIIGRTVLAIVRKKTATKR